MLLTALLAGFPALSNDELASGAQVRFYDTFDGEGWKSAVAVSFLTSNVVFKRGGEGFEGGVSLSVEGPSGTGYWLFSLTADEMGRSPQGDTVTRLLSFDRVPGTVKLTVKDVNSNRVLAVVKRAPPRGKEPSLRVGTPLFRARSGALYLRPTVTDTTVSVTIPLRATEDAEVTVRWSLKSARGGEPSASGDRSVAVASGVAEIRLPVPFPTLRTDDYLLDVAVLRDGREAARRRTRFFLRGLTTVTADEMGALVAALNYVWPSNGAREILSVPAERQDSALAAFWASVDKTPSTPQNELKDSFMERFRYAVMNYSGFNRLNDMGLIYVKYGPPLDVSRHPLELGGDAYEIWYYRGTKYLFVDRNGLGDYELVPLSFYNDYDF